MPGRSVRRNSSVLLAACLLATAGCSPVRIAPPVPIPASVTGDAAAKPARNAAQDAGTETANAASTARTDAPRPAAAAGSAAAPPEGTLAPTGLPGWNADDFADVASALDRQCAAARPPAPWHALCADYRANRERLRAWIEARFVARPLAGANGDATGLITGYHEPELLGSRARLAAGQVPLHRRPPNGAPQGRRTRAEIEGSGRLAGSELVWLDDPVEAFFLHVQGSGRIRLREGGVMRVGYAGDNGQPYRAIGATLIARGALTAADTNAATIKAWLRANPADATAVMHSNPRYIFFRDLGPAGDADGPPGALGVPLTPLRSIAVDPRRIPAGALAWLDTTDPLDGQALRRLVLAQDTGAAIVGPVRADLFWGTGARAAQAAGAMKQPGRLWLLEPRRAAR